VLTNKNYKKTGFAVFLSVVLPSPIRMGCDDVPKLTVRSLILGKDIEIYLPSTD
jgi:hypothetical protein